MRVMVADDAVLFREGLSRVLADAGFEVTAQVGDGHALLQRVRDAPPEVCIVDIRMPPTHTTEGLAAAKTLRESHPGVGVLVLALDELDEGSRVTRAAAITELDLFVRCLREGFDEVVARG